MQKTRRGQPAPLAKTAMARRLEQVRELRGVETLQDFHKELTKKRDGLPPFSISYSAVRNYHYDRDAPLSYLQRVADVFRVQLPWLISEDGPATADETDMIESMRAWATHTQKVEGDWFGTLDLGKDERAEYRRAALRRFQQKMKDAAVPGIPWHDARAQYMLIRAAGAYLVGIDSAVDAAVNSLDTLNTPADFKRPATADLVLTDSRSRPWWVHWYDTALDTFALRIKGLGVPSGGSSDAH